MRSTTHCFENEETGVSACVEERYSEEACRYEYVVVVRQVTVGLELWKRFWRQGGNFPKGAIKTIAVETRPFTSGEPAFRYALETAGKDASTAEDEYERFLLIPRQMPAFNANYRPRSDSEKEA